MMCEDCGCKAFYRERTEVVDIHETITFSDGKPVVIDEERGFPSVVSRSPEMWCVACGKRVPNPR